MPSWAQFNVNDSLQELNARNKEPVEKMQALLRFSHGLPLNLFKERAFVSEQGIALSKALDDSVSLGDFLGQKGSFYYFKGQFDSAAHYYYQAIHILENQQDAQKELAQVLNELAKLYRKKKEFVRAINAYDRAMELYKQMADSSGIAMIFNESGVVYEYMGDNEEAMKRFQASLDIQQALDDKLGTSYALSNIGYLHITLKKYAQAEAYLRQALAIRAEIKDTFSISLNYTELGELYVEQKRWNEAYTMFQKSADLAAKMQYLDLLMTDYRFMSDISVAQGNYKAAYTNHIAYEALKDSVYRLESATRIEEIATRYETEKKASENELLRQTITLRELELKDRENQNRIQRISTISLAVIFLLAFVLAFVIFQRIRREQQVKIQTEVNHAQETERRRISRDLHDHLGAQMSYMVSVLENQHEGAGQQKLFTALKETARQAIMTLRETVWAINNTSVTVENFSDRFKHYAHKLLEFSTTGIRYNEEIETDQVLSPAVALHIYRLCQEAFSNAVKHSAAKQIDVTVRTNSDYTFYFSVQDDGIGFDPENDKKEGHYGLENMKFRAQEAGAHFRIQSQPGKGALVEVYISANVS